MQSMRATQNSAGLDKGTQPSWALQGAPGIHSRSAAKSCGARRGPEARLITSISVFIFQEDWREAASAHKTGADPQEKERKPTPLALTSSASSEWVESWSC